MITNRPLVQPERGPVASKKLRFEGSTGDKLAARLDLPVDGAPRAYALFAHCFTCSKNLKAVVNIGRALNRAGIGVLRFDFTGLGESEGDFADTNFSSNVEDLVAAARFLEAEYRGPAILLGHSLGGAAVIRAATAVSSAKAVATIGAPAEPAHVKGLLTGSIEEIERRGEAEVELAGRRFQIRRQFLEDLEAAKMQDALSDLGRALLVFHSPVDGIVGIDNAEEIYKAAKHPKSFVSLDRADHLLADEEDSLYVGAVLAAWARKYVDELVADERPETDTEGGVVVSTGEGGFRTEIVAGGHGLVADEPESVGGTDTGPSPYDLLTAALGACTSMTLRTYADRKGWPLEEARVRLRHQKTHAEDRDRCETERVRLDEIEREVELAGSLSAQQRERLIEIAERCPVGRTLEGGVRIVTCGAEAKAREVAPDD